MTQAESTRQADALLKSVRAAHPTGAADLGRLLDVHAAQASAGCPWRCSGHNKPVHNK